MIKFMLVAMIVIGPSKGQLYVFPQHEFDSLEECQIAALYAEREAKGAGEFGCAKITKV